MNNEEIKALISQLKGVGLDEEKIMGVFYEAFTEGKMDRKDLETLAGAMGYELTDDFKEDTTPDPIAGEKIEGANKVASELEDAKEIGPEETKEEFKEKIEDLNDSEDGDEDKEWEKAQKMFKI